MPESQLARDEHAILPLDGVAACPRHGRCVWVSDDLLSAPSSPL